MSLNNITKTRCGEKENVINIKSTKKIKKNTSQCTIRSPKEIVFIRILKTKTPSKMSFERKKNIPNLVISIAVIAWKSIFDIFFFFN